MTLAPLDYRPLEGTSAESCDRGNGGESEDLSAPGWETRRQGFGRGYVGEKGENMKRTSQILLITGTNYKPTRPINFQISNSESSIRPSLDLLSYHFGDLTCFPETDRIYGPQPSTR